MIQVIRSGFPQRPGIMRAAPHQFAVARRSETASLISWWSASLFSDRALSPALSAFRPSHMDVMAAPQSLNIPMITKLSMVIRGWRHGIGRQQIQFIQHAPGKLDSAVDRMNVCHRLLELGREFLDFVC